MNRKSGHDDLDEVDSLLRAAQDEVLLNLSVNSHMSRGTSETSYIDPDLNRRFQALKSSRSEKSSQPSSSAKPESTSDIVKPKHDGTEIGEDDLYARFTALKSSIPSSSSTSISNDQKLTRFDSGGADEEDEVQKLIQWAIDAARLDPSPPSDDEVDNNDGSNSNDDDDSDDDSDDDRKIARKKKGQKKK